MSREELLKQDVLVVETGCGAIASAKLGLLLGEAGLDQGRPRPARSLRDGRHPAGAAHGLLRGQHPHPDRADPDGRRRRPGRRHRPDPGGRPGARVDERESAVHRHLLRVASGAYVIFGGSSPVSGMPDRVSTATWSEATSAKGWEEAVRRQAGVHPDPDEMIRATLEHIDKKRAALGLPATTQPLRPQRRCPHVGAGTLPLEERLYGRSAVRRDLAA
jgi:anaerobic carbon-monoxide dehydrogenase catalytic subunit